MRKRSFESEGIDESDESIQPGLQQILDSMTIEQRDLYRAMMMPKILELMHEIESIKDRDISVDEIEKLRDSTGDDEPFLGLQSKNDREMNGER